jgi:acetyl esterase/lipase
MASAAGADIPNASAALWTEDGRVLMRAIRVENELSPWEWYSRLNKDESTPRVDWWAFAHDSEPVNITKEMPKTPVSLRPAAVSNEYVGIAGEDLWSLDIESGKARKLNEAALPAGAEIVWPLAQGTTSELLIAGKRKERGRPVVRAVLHVGSASLTPLAVPGPAAELETYAPARSMALFRDPTPAGAFLWSTDTGGKSKKLLSLNEQMANVAWGEKMLFDYRGNEGDALKAAVILPPDYKPGRKYPVLVWVYAGSVVRDLNNYFLATYQPGQYNLQLYAAKGYVVLVPSMPLKPDGAKNDDYIDLPKGVMPAVDRLIDLGIADPDRLAVMGQSYGGYSTYSLVTYTNRFKAAIAMAGLTDLFSAYGQFDTTARSYPGIEHQKSANWGLSEGGQISMGGPPSEDLWRYLRNSPLYFADRVQTPLLLIHGEQDIRGPMTQAEEFFFALYRKGSRAKLLRYWGEDHGLRQSPANVRDIVGEIFAWLETNMPEKAAPTPAAAETGRPN